MKAPDTSFPGNPVERVPHPPGATCAVADDPLTVRCPGGEHGAPALTGRRLLALRPDCVSSNAGRFPKRFIAELASLTVERGAFRAAATSTNMTRSLAQALLAYPLFFAPVPPPSRTPPHRVAERVEEVARLIEQTPRIDAIDVPELVDENHEGRPRYRTDDPRTYGRTIAERTGLEVIVNKVVAHLESHAALEAWAQETVRLGVRHAVLVGGTSRFIPYPGLPVAEANRVVRPILAGSNGLLGNISIPQRRGEAHRMVSKTRAGASFFTTQLLFAPEAISETVASYDKLCRQAEISPATVILSFAPVADETDIEFVRWLGADVPEESERRLMNGDDPNTSVRCIALAREVWELVSQRAADDQLRVPLGINIEQVSPRHLDGAREMLTAFVDCLPRTNGTGN